MRKLREMTQKRMGNKGFSLVELIIVVAIMAVLVGILAPQYLKYVEKSRVAADEAIAEQIKSGVSVLLTDDDYYKDITTGFTITWTGGVIDTVVIGDTTVTAEQTAIEKGLDEYLGLGFGTGLTAKKDMKAKGHVSDFRSIAADGTTVAATGATSTKYVIAVKVTNGIGTVAKSGWVE